MTNRSKVLMVVAAVFLLSTAVSSQVYDSTANSNGNASSVCDLAIVPAGNANLFRPVTIEGDIYAVYQVRVRENEVPVVIATILIDCTETYVNVVLGPRCYLEENKILTRAGDHIIAHGAYDRVGDYSTFTALNVKQSRYVLPLRNVQGAPLW